MERSTLVVEKDTIVVHSIDTEEGSNEFKIQMSMMHVRSVTVSSTRIFSMWEILRILPNLKRRIGYYVHD